MAVGVSDTAVDIDVAALDAAVEDAIAAGSPRGLRVLGYGEITLVIGWPGDAPAAAVKRLPPFPDLGRFEAYAGLLERYTAELRARGVGVTPTETRWFAGEDGGVRAYLVQPYLPAGEHLDTILRTAGTDDARRLLTRLVDTVTGCVDDRVGLDAQSTNWAVHGDELECFDVSTPMLRTPAGEEELDFSVFLSIYPWATRPLLARIAPGVMAQYHDARTVLLDFASNLHKDGMHRLLPLLIELVNERVERPLSEREVMRYFRRDKRLWVLLQQLRLADRSWQRHARRRPYPFLLPGRYRYGPPRRPERRTR